MHALRRRLADRGPEEATTAGAALVADALAADALAADALAADALAAGALAAPRRGGVQVGPRGCLVAVVLLSAVALADGARAQDAPAPSEPAEAAEQAAREPTFPDEETLRTLAASDVGAARPVLRRAARSAPDPALRALAVQLLGARDPSGATARICARVLRVDRQALVRRAAAECIGRLGPELGAAQTPALVAALQDEVLDVVTMAGWALANVGDAAALEPVTALARHEDPRVAKLFYGYAERMRTRLGLDYEEPAAPATDAEGRRLVPPPAALVADASGLDVALATGWLGLYGAMAGWLHGGLFFAAHAGASAVDLAALTALGGAAAGAAAAGTYGFLRANDIRKAQTVVELGAFGTLAGYGAGILSGPPPGNAISTANLGLLGTLAGTAVGVVLAETQPPSAGALALGVGVGTGTAVSVGALAGGYGFSLGNAFGAALWAGGLSGAAATIVAGDADVGLFPIAGATAGGLAGAGAGAFLIGIVEGAQLPANGPRWTEGAGWVTAGGYAAGAVLGGSLALLLPKESDPFLASSLRLSPPTMGLVPSAAEPGQAVPVALLQGTF